MERSKNSISPDALHARLGSEAAPIIVDVRSDTDFSVADRLVADAFHCVHGHQVSQGVTAALRP